MPDSLVGRARATLAVRFARPSLPDTIAVLVSLAAVAADASAILFQSGGDSIGGIAALIIVLAGIITSRYRPWIGIALILVALLIGALFWQPLVIWTIAVFTVFSLTVKGVSAIALSVVVGPSVYLAEVYAEGAGWVNATAIIAVTATVAASASGSALLSRRRYREALKQRELDVIASRENEANRRVAEERLRIARDLHDVVGHEIAVVSMHLGVAEVSLPRAGADDARAALESARVGLQAVLVETQTILGVLRRGSGAEAQEESLRPTPGAGALSTLIDSYRSIGLEVTATLGQLPARLDPAVDAAIYRIVQEALTNAHRHGDGAVRLSVTADGLNVHIDVENGFGSVSRAKIHARSGFGLVGMRERASSAGGALHVDSDTGTFRLSASLRADGKSIA